MLDGDGRPVRHQLVEIWQANAAGRYIHQRDQHPAPLDPNFTGVGRCLTDADGAYRFTTIKPGPYPWKNHRNAWRPAHIHFSLFGTDFTQRLITQMYFPGDPLFALDPIFQSITDPAARERLVATYDHDVTQPEWATGYRWDIVLDRRRAAPRWSEPMTTRASRDTRARPSARSSASRCRTPAAASWCRPARPDAVRLHGAVLDGAGEPVPDALLEIWQADADGAVAAARPGSLHRDGWTFTGWGRAATDADGPLPFTTVRARAPRAGAAPFFAMTVFARGLLDRLFTRVYLPGRPTLAADPLLAVAARRPPGDARRAPRRATGCGSTSAAGRPARRCSWPTPADGRDRPVLAGRRPGRRRVRATALPARDGAVEEAWLAALVGAGIAPAAARVDPRPACVDGADASASRRPRPAATRSSRWSRCCASAPPRADAAAGCTAG